MAIFRANGGCPRLQGYIEESGMPSLVSAGFAWGGAVASLAGAGVFIGVAWLGADWIDAAVAGMPPMLLPPPPPHETVAAARQMPIRPASSLATVMGAMCMAAPFPVKAASWADAR
jgi:hypothetical protein